MLKYLIFIVATVSNLRGCPDGDLRCQRCIGNICRYCVRSFPDANGVCQDPTIVVSNCYSYLKDGVCWDCDLGYYRNLKGKCIPLTAKNVENCYYSSISPSTCSHCKNRTLTMNGKCPARRPCSDPNCMICYMEGLNEACYICDENHVMIGAEFKVARCYPIEGVLTGCYYTNSTELCLDCDYGFYFNNFRCLPSPLTLSKSATLITVLIFIFNFIELGS